MTVCSVLKLFLGIDFDFNFLAYFIFYINTSAAYTCVSSPCAHMYLRYHRDVQKGIPSVVIFRERRGHGGESFVGVVNL